MLQYHDYRVGVPVHDDRKHFEFLLLEKAQAGLSWSTVLDEREGYRRAFSELDPKKWRDLPTGELKLRPGCRDYSRPDEDQFRYLRPKAFSQFRKSSEVSTPTAGVTSMAAPGEPVEDDAGDPATSPESDAFSKDLEDSTGSASLVLQ